MTVQSVPSAHPSRKNDLLAAMRMFKRELVVVALLSMVANVLMLSPTLYMLQVFDRVLVSQSELTLLALSLIALFLYLVMAFTEWMRARVLVASGIRLDAQLSARVFHAGFDAQLNAAGGSKFKSVDDLLLLRNFLTGSGVFAFLDVPWVVVYIGVLYVLHPWLGISALAFAVIQAALAWWSNRSTAAPSEATNQAVIDSHVYMLSKLRNAEALEPMGMVQNLLHHWRARHIHALNLGRNTHAITGRMTAISKFVRYTQQSLALGIGGLLAIDGQISPGAMIAANVLTSRALAPIDMLVGLWQGFIGAKEAFFRLHALLAQYPARSHAPRHISPGGMVKLVDVSATAPVRPKPILTGITLEIMPGTLTVVIGPSGSGKSTLARVILGIWPHVQGDVLLDGAPISSWDRAELGPHIGYLPQDIELFEGSIAENIARFGPIDPAKVIEAAKTTGLHGMILRFPRGYDTSIGEAGRFLSGGQRQRIGLARAVYGKPALVILDEPNANLDEVGETALMKTVESLKLDGKSILLITHRPAAMSAADQLVVLRDGKISMAGQRDAVLLALHHAKSQENASAAAPA